MNIVDREDWGALPAKTRSPFKGFVNGFVVHHTTGQHLGRTDSAAWVRAIQRYHMSKGWADIGYHFLVDQFGQVFEGRGWDVTGAHAANRNGDTIGVAFLGDGSGQVPYAVFRALEELYEKACERYASTLLLMGHRDVGSTACPGDVIYSWLKDGGYRAPSGTPLLTRVDTVSQARAQQWARNNKSADLFVNDIIPALYDAAREARRLNNGLGPDAAMMVAQSAKETGWGHFRGVLTPAFRNTAGIKTAKGGGNFDPEAHQRFLTWADGARAHANHLAAYTGQRPVGTPHGRYHTVNALSWAGTIKTVEQLGARWAPNPQYGLDIVRMMAELTRVPEPAPVVPPAPSDPVLRVGSSGPEVAQVQTWLFADGLFGVGTFDAVRAFQKKHGLSADGVVGPRTWAKLREVFE
jgi:hypothetical protein